MSKNNDGKKFQSKSQSDDQEPEVISVNQPLLPWKGKARDYQPDLSDEFKKRQKLNAKAFVLLEIQKEKQREENKSTTAPNKKSKKITVQFVRKSQKQDNTQYELQKSLDEQIAISKKLQKELDEERKAHRVLSEKFEQERRIWHLERETVGNDRRKSNDMLVSLESQLQINHKKIQTIVEEHEAKLDQTCKQNEQQQQQILNLEQELAAEKSRRKTLHEMLAKNMQESRAGLEKSVEADQKRDGMARKLNSFSQEKQLWEKEKQDLENKIAELRQSTNKLQNQLEEREILRKNITKLRNKLTLFQEQKSDLEVKVRKYQRFGVVDFLVDEEIVGTSGIYKILEPLQSGGMSQLYLAEDMEKQRKVVVKTLLMAKEGDDNKKIMRFIQEARMSLSFDHPNLVRGFDFCQTPKQVFLVMEYIVGSSLENVVSRKNLAEREATDIILQIARSLSYLNKIGVVHRDVKPANIMLTEDGVAKLMDFGILRQISSKCLMTTTGIIMGTPYYLSPEQITDDKVGIKSDIYSLGITFYQLITGEVPFVGENQVEVIAKRLTKTVTKPNKINPDISNTISNLIEKMMDKKPGKRPFPDEIIKELETFLAN